MYDIAKHILISFLAWFLTYLHNEEYKKLYKLTQKNEF